MKRVELLDKVMDVADWVSGYYGVETRLWLSLERDYDSRFSGEIAFSYNDHIYKIIFRDEMFFKEEHHLDRKVQRIKFMLYDGNTSVGKLYWNVKVDWVTFMFEHLIDEISLRFV